jgi:ADP-heptose:LPS heptosyltransferase
VWGCAVCYLCAVKILVLRFSSIGDLVLTTPVLRGLHIQLGAEVHLLTKTAMATVLEGYEHLAAIHTIETEGIIERLRNERYDHIIDLHHNLRSLRIKRALSDVPASSLNKLNLQKWLLVHTGWDLLPDQHIVHRYLHTVQHLGVRYDGAGLDFPIAPHIMESLNVEIPPANQPYIVFVLGAAHATKQVLPDLWPQVAAQLDVPIVLLGGPKETGLGEQVAAAIGQVPSVLVQNLCGRLNLAQSAAWVACASCVVTPDTGLMHIAAALRRPVVAIWGSTVPRFGMYPWYPDGAAPYANMEVAGLRCRPCSKIGFERCPKGHFNCMRLQYPTAIAAQVRALMEGIRGTNGVAIEYQ